ncbi:MAG: polysaccharide biosynthesis tyrosine autokinase [Gammaproteobacteria bacterium]|nr:MAG: polysaccharide biosynthesis tyrosine autokinase [Gammaproteobacteria bacterium]UTW42328.1 polysaccharide biosynthesis tyrosine autokinase [bacterium SCSIO 12844]
MKNIENQNKYDKIDLKALLVLFNQHKVILISTTVIFMFFAGLYTLIRIPVYTANALISISDDDASNNLTSLLGDSLPLFSNNGSKAAKQAQIIKSRSVLLPVVKALGLNIIVTPDYFPLIGHRMALNYQNSNYTNKPAKPTFGLNQYDWGGSRIKIDQFDVSSAWINKNFEVTYLGNNKYQIYAPNGKLLLTGDIGKTEMVKLDAIHTIKIKVADINANTGITFSMKRIHDNTAIANILAHLNIMESISKGNLLTLHYQGAEPEKMVAILNAILNSAVRSDIKRKSANSASVLKFLKAQLPTVENQLQSAETELNKYRSKTGYISIPANSKLLLEQLSQYDSKIAELELRQNQMGVKLTADNPELKLAQMAISKLKAQREELEKTIKSLPDRDQVVINLMRTEKVQSIVYENIFRQIQQYEILKAGTISSLDIIDHASTPYIPVNKPSGQVVMIAGLLGLILCIAFILFRRQLFKNITDPVSIEEIFNLEMIGSLAKSLVQEKMYKKFKKLKSNHLELLHEIDPYDIDIESLRGIRTNLIFKSFEENKQNKIITISGPKPNIGKSFISVNLAQVFAEFGKKTLLIDSDIRRGDLHVYLAPNKRQPGFLDVLQSNVSIEEAINTTRFENLDFMPTGKLNQGSHNILKSDKIQTLLDKLSMTYDFIIVDTAPILAVTDAVSIMKQAGINVLVFADNQHNEREIKLTLKKFASAGVTIDGFIFNLVKKPNYGYGYYNYKYETVTNEHQNTSAY